MIGSRKSSNSIGVFARIARRFFKHPTAALFLLVAIIAFGAVTYTNLIRREGFPPVDVPITFVAGTYFADDANLVDEEVVQPLSKLISEVEGVSGIVSSADANSFQIIAELNNGFSSAERAEVIRSAISDSRLLPSGASFEIPPVNAAKFAGEYDMLVSLYARNGSSAPEDLEAIAGSALETIIEPDVVSAAAIIPLTRTGVNPATNVEVTQQVSFGRVGLTGADGDLEFFPSVTIGVTGRGGEDLDIFELSEEVQQQLTTLNNQLPPGYEAVVSADFSYSVNNQIQSLQQNVVSGIAAVALISALMISWRISLLTAVFMLTVILASISVLYLIGYTLNTITLFALVLALGLFVDDATIIAEALYAARKEGAKPTDIVAAAVRGVGNASFAGTLTTVLVFVPLLFIGGVLGDFIFLLPMTIIISLLISFLLSITIIPLLSRFSILTSAQLAKPEPRHNPVPDYIANTIMLLRTDPFKGRLTAAGMVLMSLALMAASVFFAGKLTFNIFPSAKDSDDILLRLSFSPGLNIDQAESVAVDVEQQAAEILGTDVETAFYGRGGAPNQRNADILFELTPFNERETTAAYYVERIEQSLVDIENVNIQVQQLDPGPPEEEYPFRMQIFSEDPRPALQAANEIASWLDGRSVERLNGTVAQITDTRVAGTNVITRDDQRRYVQVLAAFDGDDVSALVQAAQSAVEEEYPPERLENEFGLAEQDVAFDFGQESENEESFASLGPAGIVAVATMFLLLAIQFRSIIKPLLIFLALPFSLFGVAYGLYLSGNALSFFAMVGFIGLIGIAVNNTILLVDAANQQQAAGAGPVAAIAEASRRRFRPLFTTTATTVAALAPLAITDPFWEPLAITIMFGLLSSTFLVIMAFPYYYLAVEWVTRKSKHWFNQLRRVR